MKNHWENQRTRRLGRNSLIASVRRRLTKMHGNINDMSDEQIGISVDYVKENCLYCGVRGVVLHAQYMLANIRNHFITEESIKFRDDCLEDWENWKELSRKRNCKKGFSS